MCVRLCVCVCVRVWSQTNPHYPCLGRFNLDPNRVLDVLMEAFSCYHDDREVFLALLRGYPCEQATFVNILGFKFQSCQAVSKGVFLECFVVVKLNQKPQLLSYDYYSSISAQSPESSELLFRLAAVLLHEKLVSLTDLYPHVSHVMVT